MVTVALGLDCETVSFKLPDRWVLVLSGLFRLVFSGMPKKTGSCYFTELPKEVVIDLCPFAQNGLCACGDGVGG